MLSARLQGIADLVPACRRVIDIGTDHAYLPIELVRQERCATALAADLRPGPLQRAKKNIKDAGLESQISLCLSNGLDDIALQPDDVVIIAGLGGLEMIDILSHASQTHNLKHQVIILQPMKSAFALRRWLSDHSFSFDMETLVNENNHDYPLIRTSQSENTRPLSHLACWLGPVLMKSQPQGYQAYARRVLDQLRKRSRGDPELKVLQDELLSHLEEVTRQSTT